MISFDVICTFDHLPQRFLDFDVQASITETDFVNTILQALSREELKQLVKLSCCQHLKDDEDEGAMLPFIQASRGKYFFNSAENKYHPEVVKWDEFRNQMLLKKQ